MKNEELAKYGFELCEMSGECDFCEKEVEQQNYFWRSTSYEYVEGDYYCRECASKEASAMKPSDFNKHPYGSVLQNNESEVVARNIMVILSHAGNEFRLLSWGEYKEARQKDGNFTESEKLYFDKVVGFCVTAESAKAFCANWGAN